MLNSSLRHNVVKNSRIDILSWKFGIPLMYLFVAASFWQANIVKAEEKLSVVASQDSMSANGLSPKAFKYDPGTRRDPFRPIPKKVRPSSMEVLEPSETSTTLQSELKPNDNPEWKLLAIADGQFGRQAVIRISPKRQRIVSQGEEIALSGWIVEMIERDQVIFQSRSATSAESGSASFKRLVVSFPSLEAF